ncbi:hypothetical protein PMAYCL1PPCAC_32120, partial [Pristionchus mayeri]
ECSTPLNGSVDFDEDVPCFVRPQIGCIWEGAYIDKSLFHIACMGILYAIPAIIWLFMLLIGAKLLVSEISIIGLFVLSLCIFVKVPLILLCARVGVSRLDLSPDRAYDHYRYWQFDAIHTCNKICRRIFHI